MGRSDLEQYEIWDLDEKVYKSEEVIFKEGSAGDVMFLIASGKVRISHNVGKTDSVLAVLEAGEFFGEMSLLDGGPRSASAVAAEDTVLLEVESDVFYGLLAEGSTVASQIMANTAKVVCQRLRTADSRLAALCERNAGAAKRPGEPGSGTPWVPPKEPGVAATDACSDLRRLRNFRAVQEIDPGNLPWDSIKRSYPSGRIIFEEGSAGNAMFLIASGKVKISQKMGPTQNALAILGAHEFFGEMALLDDGPRSVSAIAMEDTAVFETEKNAFSRSLIDGNETASHILRHVARVVCHRLRMTDARLAAACK